MNSKVAHTSKRIHFKTFPEKKTSKNYQDLKILIRFTDCKNS